MRTAFHLNSFSRARIDEQGYIEDCRTADLDIEMIKYFKRERNTKNGYNRREEIELA